MPGDAANPAARMAQGSALIHGPIGSTLFRFALPVIGANALQSLNGLINAAWVSHILGINALAATSNANMLLFLLLSAAFGIGMACNIFVAQAVGRGDTAEIKRVVGTGGGFFLTLSIIIGALGFLLSPHVLTMMRTPDDVMRQAIAYLRMIFVATPFMYMFAFVMMIQRGGGDSRTPFLFMIVSVGLDVVLNPLLMRGIGPIPALGISGSALSTVIAQAVGLIGMLAHMYRRNSPLLLRGRDLRYLRPHMPTLSRLIKKGVPMSLQMLIMSAAAVVMISFVNRFGARTIAAYGAASQLWAYIQMPAIGLGTSVSSMAAQNVGAGRWDRVSQITTTAVLSGFIFTAVLTAITYIIGDPLMAFFLPGDPDALDIARHINGIVLWGFILFSTTFILFGTVRATGAVIPPLIILVFSMWIVRIPFANHLMPSWGADAIWWSFPLSAVLSNVCAIAYYRFGNWRRSRLMPPAGMAPAE